MGQASGGRANSTDVMCLFAAAVLELQLTTHLLQQLKKVFRG